MPVLNQDRLRELLHYNPETGVFTWNVRRGRALGGDIAGSVGLRGYRKISVDGNRYYAHRLAWLYVEGFSPSGCDVDHIDRDKANNSWGNLRMVSRSCNLRNSNVRKDNTSGVTGVYWSLVSRKWMARVREKGEFIHLGLFDEFVDAVRSRWEGEKKYNYPNCNSSSSAFLYLKSNKI